MSVLRYIRKIPHPFKSGTLRRTLVIYLLIACLFPPIIFSGYTYSTSLSILTHKIKAGIDASLKQEATGLENVFNNLDFVSKQFALDGQTAERVNEYLNTVKVTEKAEIMKDIEESLNVVNFTNPNLGLTVYYNPQAKNPILFTNLAVSTEFGVSNLPNFVRYNGAIYFGPHQTQYKNSENIVFSSLREVRTDGEQPVYIYLESNNNLFRQIMNSQSNETYGMKVSHYLINEAGLAFYADDGEAPFDAQSLKWEMAASGDQLHEGQYLFGYESPQGWKLVTAVDQGVFNHEINVWIWRMAVLFIVTSAFAVFLATMVWRKVYGSLRKVNREIVRMTGEREAPVSLTNVEEFDQLLRNFQVMKTTVNELISEIASNERLKGQLEMEKLLSQINPHFLHNTLNTVQWLARSNGQDDIDRLLTLLVQVLHYNMGKQSLIVTVRDEIEALKKYIELQGFRYEGELDFDIQIEEETLNLPIPRFLLQPLVENAIYHGKNEEHGIIQISTLMTSQGKLRLEVKDNGPGIDEDTVQRLIGASGEPPILGMGIGLKYVRSLLERYYGNEELLIIQSKPGEGTILSVEIPNDIKEERYDQRISG
ncbi:sensor histidine kinase [Cohnella sp. WQ 127256]|uniref:sensor histidine kinase n=1 Tax=Cohnella sp. WQ 127256 TaxID=2938790 RepID=UPI0021199F8F|nr:sensor histidine kinase [Cohnella sp. WQ 127256]